MVSVNPTHAFLTHTDAEAECPPMDGRALLAGLHQQLALSDRLGLDLVSIRIAESLDQLIAELSGADSATLQGRSLHRH